ncbi:MAG: hypothetical protein HN435_08630, partial [Nitrospinaceae bacterium]|nr:hypothetical protein [Nitrospinaceae bacterium]
NVVATMLMPTHHHGSERPATKYDAKLVDAAFDVQTPAAKANRRYANINVQSRVDSMGSFCF